MTGYLRIGGALLVGVLIVLAAFAAGQESNGSGRTGNLEVAHERTYIAPGDTDRDGTPDWQEQFSARVFDAITSTATPVHADSATYEAPTTFTGKFAEAFFQDYMQGKIQGADLTDPSAFVTQAIQTIESSTESKRYTRLDIAVIPDSPQDIRTYGNTIGDILKKHSAQNENEALITQRALEQNDPAQLTALNPILNTYELYIRDTLLTPVPQIFVEDHIELLTAYEAIATDIRAMRQVFGDPLYGLARIKRYQDDATALHMALRSIIQKLTAENVMYSKEEPGFILYTWSN